MNDRVFSGAKNGEVIVTKFGDFRDEIKSTVK